MRENVALGKFHLLLMNCMSAFRPPIAQIKL